MNREGTRVRLVVAGDEPQCGCFTATVRTQQAYDFARLYTEGKIVQNLAGTEELVDVVQYDGRHATGLIVGFIVRMLTVLVGIVAIPDLPVRCVTNLLQTIDRLHGHIGIPRNAWNDPGLVLRRVNGIGGKQ